MLCLLGRLRRHRHDPLVCREFVTEDKLSDAERTRFEAHLAECHGCSGYLEDMRRLVGSLHELPALPRDPATREALLPAFRDLREQT